MSPKSVDQTGKVQEKSRDPRESSLHIVGVISDTHGLLRPEAVKYLDGSELIIHAGDIGRPDILENLRTVGPVVAIRGNRDRDDWARELPETETVQIGAASIYVLHDLNQLDLDPAASGFDAVISGHSHRPSIQHRGAVLFLNPGSAGPRRFKLPISLAIMRIEDGSVEGELVIIPPTPQPKRSGVSGRRSEKPSNVRRET